MVPREKRTEASLEKSFILSNVQNNASKCRGNVRKRVDSTPNRFSTSGVCYCLNLFGNLIRLFCPCDTNDFVGTEFHLFSVNADRASCQRLDLLTGDDALVNSICYVTLIFEHSCRSFPFSLLFFVDNVSTGLLYEFPQNDRDPRSDFASTRTTNENARRSGWNVCTKAWMSAVVF